MLGTIGQQKNMVLLETDLRQLVAKRLGIGGTVLEVLQFVVIVDPDQNGPLLATRRMVDRFDVDRARGRIASGAGRFVIGWRALHHLGCRSTVAEEQRR